MDEIASQLNSEGIKPLHSSENVKWVHSSISYILSNERYIGDSLWQKTYATDTLPARQVKNRGEREKYYAEATHPPINTLDSDSEMLITMLGAFAQAESESISENVKWGVRQAMREGKAKIQYKHLYAYERGEDGKPKIIPEQAKVVRQIYESFLAGYSIRGIKDELERQGIPASKGGAVWSESAIRNILKNEKYCGDVLMQKTYTQDCISHKQIRNMGQLPMYLVQDNHEAIISRVKFKLYELLYSLSEFFE